jgi:hypothetical protein
MNFSPYPHKLLSCRHFEHGCAHVLISALYRGYKCRLTLSLVMARRAAQ